MILKETITATLVSLLKDIDNRDNAWNDNEISASKYETHKWL